MKAILLDMKGMYLQTRQNHEPTERIRIPVLNHVTYIDDEVIPPMVNFACRIFEYSHTVGKVRFYQEVI